VSSAVTLYATYLRELGENYPDDAPLIRAALEAYDAIQSGEPITQDLLHPIVVAASDSRKLIFDIAVSFLDEFTGKYEEARVAVAKMAQVSQSYTRFNAIMCIGKSSPLEFKLRLIRQGLRNKSSKVRRKAADWGAFRMQLMELLPDLEETARGETSAKEKAGILWYVDLLRNGWPAEPLSSPPDLKKK
jgi:hypothetical protein